MRILIPVYSFHIACLGEELNLKLGDGPSLRLLAKEGHLVVPLTKNARIAINFPLEGWIDFKINKDVDE